MLTYLSCTYAWTARWQNAFSSQLLQKTLKNRIIITMIDDNCTIVLVFKCLHGFAPRYLAELRVPVADITGHRNLRSATRGLLNFPRYNMTSYGRRAFSYTGLHAWNSLPEHLWQTTSIDLFKRSLKTFLFTLSLLKTFLFKGYISLRIYLLTYLHHHDVFYIHYHHHQHNHNRYIIHQHHCHIVHCSKHSCSHSK